jgi:hypothetical protein
MKGTEIVITLLLVAVLVFVLIDMLIAWKQCADIDGTIVRGLFRLECIRGEKT